MSRTVLVKFIATSGEEAPSLVHRLRNFGEDVARHLRDTSWGRIDTDEVDRATHEFTVTMVKQANRGRLIRWLNEEADRQSLVISVEEHQLPD